MARRIVITSGKGGVGKTTVTAFLGAYLASMGKRVVLLDLDFGLNNLDVSVGVEDKVIYDIIDAVEGRCRVKQAIIDCAQKNLFVIPSCHTFSLGINAQSVKLLIEGLSSSFDFILIDCPAGIDSGFTRSISCANEAIVVVNPTLQSLRDADKVLTILKSYELDAVNLVVNRARRDLMRKGLTVNSKEIENILKTPILSTVYESDEILLSKNCCATKSRALKYFKKLAESVINNAQNARDYTSVYGGLFKEKK